MLVSTKVAYPCYKPHVIYFPTLAEYISMYSPFLFVPLLPHPDAGDDTQEYAADDDAFDPDDVY